MVKRNCWGVPMADEVIERQGCCEKERVPEKGTKENPHRAYLYAPSYYCKGCRGVCVSYIDTKLQQCSACGAWNNLV